MEREGEIILAEMVSDIGRPRWFRWFGVNGRYSTQDFERVVALRARMDAIARHAFLKKSDRFAETIVFCVDQEHASEMRAAVNNLNAVLAVQHPNYVCRVTANERQYLRRTLRSHLNQRSPQARRDTPGCPKVRPHRRRSRTARTGGRTRQNQAKSDRVSCALPKSHREESLT